MIPNENRLLKRVQVMIVRAISGGGTTSVASSQISDATTTGRAVLTATDQASARTAIGAVATTDTRLTDARAPTAHQHPISDVTGLSSALAAKADTSALSGYATSTALTAGLATKADAVAPAYSYPTPTLNTAAQLSATRAARVVYPVDVGINSLLTNVEGIIFLEIADDAAFTTNVVTVMSAGQLLGGVINIQNRGTVTLCGEIPAGKYRRLRTQSVTGSPAFTARQGQHVLV
jgi:hypothetical protein